MFGRDPVLPVNTLLGPKMRYLGNDLNILSLEAMKNMIVDISHSVCTNTRRLFSPKQNNF